MKLRATALNALAVASVVAGFITPLAALTFGINSSPDRSAVFTGVAASAWFGIGVALHLTAGRVLGGLEE